MKLPAKNTTDDRIQSHQLMKRVMERFRRDMGHFFPVGHGIEGKAGWVVDILVSPNYKIFFVAVEVPIPRTNVANAGDILVASSTTPTAAPSSWHRSEILFQKNIAEVDALDMVIKQVRSMVWLFRKNWTRKKDWRNEKCLNTRSTTSTSPSVRA